MFVEIRSLQTYVVAFLSYKIKYKLNNIADSKCQRTGMRGKRTPVMGNGLNRK